MAKRSLAMQFDEAVQAMLVSLRPRPEEAPDRELLKRFYAHRLHTSVYSPRRDPPHGVALKQMR